MNKMQFIASSALAITVVSLVEPVSEPRFCDTHEVCTPLPMAQGDEPLRDGPGGPLGLTRSAASFSVTGPTGPAGPVGPAAPIGPTGLD